MKRHGKRCQLLEVVLIFFMRVFFFFCLHVGLRARTAVREYQGDQAWKGARFWAAIWVRGKTLFCDKYVSSGSPRIRQQDVIGYVRFTGENTYL